MPKSASLTQNMDTMHLKTKVSGIKHSTQLRAAALSWICFCRHSGSLSFEE